MSVHWTIDSRTRAIEMVADGDVSAADAKAYFDAVEGAGALSYNKLLDYTPGRSTMTPDDLMSMAVRIRGRPAQSAMGAAAVVLTREQSVLLARVLGAAAVADRPLRVFDSRVRDDQPGAPLARVAVSTLARSNCANASMTRSVS